VNGNFDAYAGGWGPWSASSNGGSWSTIEGSDGSVNPYNSTFMAKFSIPANTNASGTISQTFTVSSSDLSTTICPSFYMYSIVNTKIAIEMDIFDPNLNKVSTNIWYLSSSSGWTQFVLPSFKPASTGNYTVQLVVYSNFGLPSLNASAVYFDGVSVIKQPPMYELNDAGLYLYNGPTSYIKLGQGNVDTRINTFQTNTLTDYGNANIYGNLSVNGSGSFGSILVGNNLGLNIYRLYTAGSDTNHYIYSTGTYGNNTYFGEYQGNFHWINTYNGAELAVIAGSGSNIFTVRGGNGYAPNGSWISGSDIRLKTDIKPITNALEKVMQLTGVTFEWNRAKYPDRHFTKGRQIGLIAQWVEPIVPEVVTTDDSGYKALDYSKLTALLINAVKEQQLQIDNIVSLGKNKGISVLGDIKTEGTVTAKTASFDTLKVNNEPVFPTSGWGPRSQEIGKTSTGVPLYYRPLTINGVTVNVVVTN
jgi:hypothetical protein